MIEKLITIETFMLEDHFFTNFMHICLGKNSPKGVKVLPENFQFYLEE